MNKCFNIANNQIIVIEDKKKMFFNLIDIGSLVLVLFIILHNPSVPDSQYGEESEIDNGRGKVVSSAIVNYIVIADSDEKHHREHQKCDADIEQSLCLPVFFFCCHCRINLYNAHKVNDFLFQIQEFCSQNKVFLYKKEQFHELFYNFANNYYTLS